MKRLVRCFRCKTVESIYAYKPRKRGHIKHMWCYKCKAITAHLEVKPPKANGYIKPKDEGLKGWLINETERLIKGDNNETRHG